MADTTTSSPGSASSAAHEPAEDVVARLRSTFESGRTRSLPWRRAQLDAIARLIDEREGDLTRALVADLRRTPFEAALFDLVSTKAEIKHAVKHLEQWMKPRSVPTGIGGRPGKAWYQYEPLGVSLVIAPWNYPIHLALAPLVGAVAAGCCAVIKPSELTPACSLVLADLIPRYLDSDAFAVVEGGPAETTAVIEQRPDHIFFTGSPTVGAAVMTTAAPHLIPVTLELGGKCPAIVAASADIDVTARRIAFGKLVNSGQTCVAPDYVLADSRIRDDLVDALVSTMRQFSEGRSKPVLNERHAARLARLVERAGGTTVLGGDIDISQAKADPTVIVDPAPNSTILSEEIFGPILPVVTVDSLDGAVAHVNRGTRPLATYLFTEERPDEDRVLAEVTTGGMVVNHVMVHLGVSDLPFGGVGTSGTGTYHGHWGFESFSHPKAVVRKPAHPDLSFIYPPYSERMQKLMRRLM